MSNKRILFIDDEKLLIHAYAQIFGRLGYQIVTSTNSVEALALFKEKTDEFVRIIIGMTMPTMTGVKLTTEMIKIRSDISIILCSGFNKKFVRHLPKNWKLRPFFMIPVNQEAF